MVIVTGAAGLIGSAIIWKLNVMGITDIIAVDHLGTDEKWKNLVGLDYLDYFEHDDFLRRVEDGLYDRGVETVFHMGACSATTERDVSFLIENNYRYTMKLAEWAVRRKVRFIYASSAATYGDGEQGYDDDPKKRHLLRPMNAYGYSKHLFDLTAEKKGWLSTIVGLKFFNVFGPNEYHKGDMRSVICKAYPQVRDERVMRLFESHREGIEHGEQKRDFVYVKDAVDMLMFFVDKPQIGGVFNIGTGKASSWNDVAHALFAAAEVDGTIEYAPMPESIRDRYQYYTCADLTRLRSVGCTHVCMSLTDSVGDYVRNYLAGEHFLGEKR